jgi:methylated-DNA-[protein]-cysteine S-methyltransferase
MRSGFVGRASSRGQVIFPDRAGFNGLDAVSWAVKPKRAPSMKTSRARPQPQPVVYHATAPSPYGTIMLFSDGVSLTGLQLPDSKRPRPPQTTWVAQENLPVFTMARRELAAYFAGSLHEFTTPLALHGTPFQQQVWRALLRVPYGRTASYSDLAHKIKNPQAVRAVAMANARNPVPIIVPCHRVIGKDGTLTGYSGGGIERKAELLRLEGVAA